MTTTDTTARTAHKNGDTGRCQHCQQTRPLFRHEGELQFWGYDPADTAWLCAPDWSARETAIDNDEDIHIERDLIVWPEDQPTVQVHGDTAAVSGSVAARAQDGDQP